MQIHPTAEDSLLTGGTSAARVQMSVDAAFTERVHTSDESHGVHEVAFAECAR